MSERRTSRGVRGGWSAALVFLIAACILVPLYFLNEQTPGYEKYLVINIGMLLWLPVITIMLILQKDPSDFGFTVGDSRQGYKLAGFMYVLLPLPFYLFSRMPEFQAYYPIQHQAAYSPAFFLYFELSYGMYLFCWEFFFRGFMLFGLAPKLGIFSLFIQATAFGLMHLGKPPLEVIAAFPAGIILGLLAMKSKSFLPGFVLHWAAALTFDVLVIFSKPGTWMH